MMEKIDPEHVGRRLEALRLATGMTRRDFASKIGVDNSSFSKITGGVAGLSVHVAYRASNRFGVSMDYFYRGVICDLPDSLRGVILEYLGGSHS